MWEMLLTPEFFNSILRATTPILFATLASGVAAKAGICNMALEGILLFCALFGVIFSNLTGSWVIAILLTMLCGGMIGLILAFFILNLKTDEILAAIAINLTATGGTVLLLLAFSGDRGSSTFSTVPAPSLDIPLVGSIPFIGEILSGRNVLTYLSILMVIVMHLFLYKTPLGLKIRAVGENKNAAESVGISSRKIQYIALIISGVLCSLGGYFLSGGYMNAFTKDMQAGDVYKRQILNSAVAVTFPPTAAPPISTICSIFSCTSGNAFSSKAMLVSGPNGTSVSFSPSGSSRILPARYSAPFSEAVCFSGAGSSQ